MRTKAIASISAQDDQHAQRLRAIRRFARREYGLEASVKSLPGERDLNFRLTAGTGAYVLKLMHAGCDPQLVDLQIAAMAHINSRLTLALTPVSQRTLSGRSTAWFNDPAGGQQQLAWLLPFLPGKLMAQCRPWSTALAARLGAALGAVDLALTDFSHPALARALEWDLRQSHWLAERAEHIASEGDKALVLRVAQHFEDHLSPQLSTMPRCAIHGDANDMNIFLSPAPGGDWRVSGLIDFGDMVATPRVCEPAIAIAYVMLGEGDALARAGALLSAYQDQFPLAPEQLAVLPTLIRLRWAVTVTNAAFNRQANPDNSYLAVSESDAWRLLHRFGSDLRPLAEAAAGSGSTP